MSAPSTFPASLHPNWTNQGFNPVPDAHEAVLPVTPRGISAKIADRLFTKLGSAAVGRFSDGEISVQINENVRGSDVFIIQSTCAPYQ